MATKTAWIEIAISASKAMNAINRMDQSFTKLGNTVRLAMTAITAIEGVRMVGEMEALSKKVDNVTAAFAQLDDPTLLQALRDATKGLVDDLTLMQQAVKFKNFGLPVEQLATMLEFAQMRAAQSGQSIDYMVESIIVGLGRESIKVLDNLQINVGEFNRLVRDGASYTDALAKLMKEEMAASSDVAASSWERLLVSFTNLKNSVANSKVFLGVSMTLELWNFWISNISKLITRVINLFIGLGKVIAKPFEWAIDKVKELIKELGLLRQYTPREEPVSKEPWSLFGSKKGLYGEERFKASNLSLMKMRTALKEYNAEIEKDQKEHNDKLIEEENRRVNAFERILESERDFQERIRIETMRMEWAREREPVGGAPGITPMFMKDGKDPEDAAKFGTELDKFNQIAELSTKYIDDFTNGLSQALIYGENFGESMANAFRAMTAQLVAAIAKALILAAILKAFPAVEALLGASNAALSVGERIIGVLTGENTRLQYDRSTSNSGRFK